MIETGNATARRETIRTNFNQAAVNRVVWLSRLAWVRFAALALLLAFFLLTKSMHAQAGPQANTTRTVRLTYADGSVQVASGDNTSFPQVVQNMPLLEGMRVITGNDGRAEIEFEDGSMVRLAPNSSVSLDQLGLSGNNYDTALSVTAGLVYLELRASDQYTYHVTYSDGVFAPVQNSTIRVRMDSQPAELAVSVGQVAVQRNSGETVQVMSGETLTGDAKDALKYSLAEGIASDSWDTWNADRDDLANMESAQQTTARNDFAGQNGYGWSDLDAYGNWYPVPGYGMVWQPLGITASFDPYGVGTWMDYPSYGGYMFVSGYPWGWTPYYCGTWDYLNLFGWGWIPDSSCMGYGFGWGGGWFGGIWGMNLNIGRAPGGYRFPVRPGQPGRGPHPLVGAHPLIAVGGGVAQNVPTHMSNGFVVYDRVHASSAINFNGARIEPLQPATSGMSGNLVHDAPINMQTHQPVMGRVANTPAPQPRTPYKPPQNNAPRGGTPNNNNRGPAPAPHNAPPAPHYNPPPSSSRPSYSGGGGHSGGGGGHSGGGGRH